MTPGLSKAWRFGQTPQKMNKDAQIQTNQRLFAVETNNLAWDLISKPGKLTIDEAEEMISAAFASLFHWSAVGKPINRGRAYGTIARALVKANNESMLALNYAKKYRALCDGEDAEDWDVVFAEAAIARAFGAIGNEAEARSHKAIAVEAMSRIEVEEDRKICEDDMKLEPWFEV